MIPLTKPDKSLIWLAKTHIIAVEQTNTGTRVFYTGNCVVVQETIAQITTLLG